MRDVVRTTFLSTLWENRWTTVPSLDFRYDFRKYRRFIYNTLTQWRGLKILKFTITCSYYLPRANDLDLWLLFAIRKQVEELSIHLGRLRIDASQYSPPQRLYSRASIRKLSLSYFRLKIEENVQWDQLKSLTILRSNSLTADAMDRILCGAPRLEELSLCIREIGKKFTIRSTSLKSLCIGRRDDCFEIVEVYLGSVLNICALNLLNLVISSRCYGRCLLDVPSLTNAVLNFFECGDEMDSGDLSRTEMFNHVFQSVGLVENLTLSNWCIKFLLYMKMNGVLVEFPNAKFLHLYPDEPSSCFDYCCCICSC